MTRPVRTYTEQGGTYTVRDAGNGSRIVRSSAGWIVRVDHPQQPGRPERWNDLLTIITARMIHDTRSAGKTLPVPWGRVIKY